MTWVNVMAFVFICVCLKDLFGSVSYWSEPFTWLICWIFCWLSFLIYFCHVLARGFNLLWQTDQEEICKVITCTLYVCLIVVRRPLVGCRRIWKAPNRLMVCNLVSKETWAPGKARKHWSWRSFSYTWGSWSISSCTFKAAFDLF